MPDLLVSTFTASLLAILMVSLSFGVSIKRVSLGGVVFGDAEDESLRKRIRAHGNFIEYAPLGLLALVLLEYRVGTSVYVWLLSGLLLFSRILHAIAMLYFSSPAPRALAMVVSHLFFLAIGLWLAVSSVM